VVHNGQHVEKEGRESDKDPDGPKQSVCPFFKHIPAQKHDSEAVQQNLCLILTHHRGLVEEKGESCQQQRQFQYQENYSQCCTALGRCWRLGGRRTQ